MARSVRVAAWRGRQRETRHPYMQAAIQHSALSVSAAARATQLRAVAIREVRGSGVNVHFRASLNYSRLWCCLCSPRLPANAHSGHIMPLSRNCMHRSFRIVAICDGKVGRLIPSLWLRAPRAVHSAADNKGTARKRCIWCVQRPALRRHHCSCGNFSHSVSVDSAIRMLVAHKQCAADRLPVQAAHRYCPSSQAMPPQTCAVLCCCERPPRLHPALRWVLRQ